MAVYKIARFIVRPEARQQAELAMHELASYVRKELPDSQWTTFRDPHAPTHYVSLMRSDGPAADEKYRKAPGTQAFFAALQPLLERELEINECELVTSSDLQRRFKQRR